MYSIANVVLYRKGATSALATFDPLGFLTFDKKSHLVADKEYWRKTETEPLAIGAVSSLHTQIR